MTTSQTTHDVALSHETAWATTGLSRHKLAHMGHTWTFAVALDAARK